MADVDWMRRRIEDVDRAFERLRRGTGIEPPPVCARCSAPSIVVNYDRRCPFCDLMRFMFTTTRAQVEKWMLFGMQS